MAIVRKRLAPSFAPLVLLSAIVSLSPGCGGGSRAAAQRWNVLLITIDTLRADHLSCYGSEHRTSPAIDALAARGMRFENAFATISYTVPSHASLFTSAYPSFHGIGVRQGGTQLDPDQATLASVLRKAGYETAAFMSNPILRHRFGLEHGFQVYADDKLVDASNGAPRERPAGETAADARAWLRASHRAPFFLWVHLQDPHGAYIPPEPFKGTFHSPPSGIALPFAGKDANDPLRGDGYEQIPGYQRLGDEHDPSYYRDRYDEEILSADAAVGTLLGELDTLGLADHTIVVLTADHGEAMGEDHYYFCHGFTLGPDQIHVPLVFAGPGIAPGVARGVASSIDVLPTVLDLLGLDAPDEARGEPLLRVLEQRASDRSRRVFAESLNQEAVIQYPFFYYRDRSDIGDLATHRVSHGVLRKLGAQCKLLTGATPETAGPAPLAELDRALDEYAKLRRQSKRTIRASKESDELLDLLSKLGYGAPVGSR